jgi:hypothetical protein
VLELKPAAALGNLTTIDIELAGGHARILTSTTAARSRSTPSTPTFFTAASSGRLANGIELESARDLPAQWLLGAGSGLGQLGRAAAMPPVVSGESRTAHLLVAAPPWQTEQDGRGFILASRFVPGRIT